MSLVRTRQRLQLIAGFACVSGFAPAAPALLDTEARAQAALGLPFYLTETLSQDIYLLAGGAQRVAQYALQLLGAATTYSQISAAPAGITVPCGYSGSLKVHAPSTESRVLHVDFQACAREDLGLVFELNGPAQFSLFDNSLEPAAVPGIRLGNVELDLDERFYFADSPNSAQHRSRNMRLTGRIPVQREQQDFEFYGPLDYQLTGFFEVSNLVPLPDGSVARRGQRYTAENLAVTGHRFEWQLGGAQILDFAFNYTAGLVTSTFFDTQAGISDSRSTSPGPLKVRWISVSHDNETISSMNVDGHAGIDWADGNGSGCVSGDYRIDTATPWISRNSQVPSEISDGDSRINDNVRVQFGALPSPTIRLNVRGVGNFRYRDSVRNITLGVSCAW